MPGRRARGSFNRGKSTHGRLFSCRGSNLRTGAAGDQAAGTTGLRFSPLIFWGFQSYVGRGRLGPPRVSPSTPPHTAKGARAGQQLPTASSSSCRDGTWFLKANEARHPRAERELGEAPRSRAVPGLFGRAELQEGVLKRQRKKCLKAFHSFCTLLRTTIMLFYK